MMTRIAALAFVLLASPAFADSAPEATVAPVVEDGKQIGYRVVEVRAESIFATVGLEKGDVVKSVNGLELDSPSRLFTVYSDFRRNPFVVVEVVRGRERLVMVHSVKER